MLKKLFTLRSAILLISCAGLVGGMGCATMLATSMDNEHYVSVEAKDLFTDDVLAFAIPDEKLAGKLGTRDAVAFLGKKQTYLLTQGGSILTNVAAQLDPDRLTVAAVSKKLFIKERREKIDGASQKKKAVWGDLELSYELSASEDQARIERQNLAALSFELKSGRSYYRQIGVNGVVHPPIKIAPAMADRLKVPRSITFYKPPKTYTVPAIEKAFFVPLAVAVDVVLIPVYFLILIQAN